MKNCYLRLAALLLGCCGFSATAYADDDFSDGYQPRPGLHFADLEFAMPRDPLLWETEVAWKARQTPQTVLSEAIRAVRDAVPVGMGQDQAALVLHRAGASCKAGSMDALICHYAAVQTRDEWVDAIDWTVKVDLADGRVAGLSLAREWRRH